MRNVFVVALAALLAGCVTSGTTPATGGATGSPAPATVERPGTMFPVENTANRPLNEVPMYGGRPQRPDLQRINDEFVATAMRTGRSKREISDQLLQRGFQFFSRGDFRTAAMRFNQGWLIEPDNPKVWHSFALLVLERDRNTIDAKRLFGQGISYRDAEGELFLDYGRFLMIANAPAEALPVLQEGLRRAPDQKEIPALLAAAEIDTGNHAGCNRARQAMAGVQMGIQMQLKQRLSSAICR